MIVPLAIAVGIAKDRPLRDTSFSLSVYLFVHTLLKKRYTTHQCCPGVRHKPNATLSDNYSRPSR